MNDNEFDEVMASIERQAQQLARRKAEVVQLLSYASWRRSESEGEAKTEWRRDTVRLDRIRDACNLCEKATKGLTT